MISGFQIQDKRVSCPNDITLKNNDSFESPGVWGMFGGDGNKDGSVNLLDESPTWEVTAGTKGYLGTDYNLDSQSNNLDKDNVWSPNIGHGTQVPN